MSEHQFHHLADVVACLPSKNSFADLKSHLTWTCAQISNSSVINRPKMCHMCCQSWSSGRFTMRLKPSSSPGPRMMKIVKKFENGDRMSSVEKSLLKRYQKNSKSNVMVLTCLSCKNSTPFKLRKPVTKRVAHVETPVITNVTVSTKKKKKKDRFAGLNSSAVISASPSLPNNSLKPSSSVKQLASIPTPKVSKVNSASTPKVSNKLNSTLTATPKEHNVGTNVNSSIKQSISNITKKGPLSYMTQMRLLNNEMKRADHVKKSEEVKAQKLRNCNIKKNSKLQNFVRKADKEVSLDDRITSLLHM